MFKRRYPAANKELIRMRPVLVQDRFCRRLDARSETRGLDLLERDESVDFRLVMSAIFPRGRTPI
jgi:hypothetical protein